MSRRIIGVRRGSTVHDRIQKGAQTISDLKLIPTTDVVDKAVCLVEDTGGFYRFDYEGTGAEDPGFNIVEPTVGPGRWFLMNGVISAPPGIDSERYRYVFPVHAVAGGEVAEYDWAHEDLTIARIEVAIIGAALSTAGSVNLTVRAKVPPKNLLALGTVDLTTLPPFTIHSLTLTGAAPDLLLSEKDLIEIAIESDNDDLSGGSIHVQVIYEVQVVAKFTGGSPGGLPATSGIRYSVLMEDPSDVPIFQPMREAWVYPNFDILSYSASVSLMELGDTLLNPSFNATYEVPPPNTLPTQTLINDNKGTGVQDVSLTPNAFNYTASYTYTTFDESVTWTLNSEDGVQSDSGQTTTRWVQNIFWGVGGNPTLPYGTWLTTTLTNSELSRTGSKQFTVTAGPGEYIWYVCREAFGNPTFYVGGFLGGFSKVLTFPYLNPHGVLENFQMWRSDNANLGTTSVTVVL